MAKKTRGPMCSTKCGPGWIDDGTMCRSRSYTWGPIGVGCKTKSPKAPRIQSETRSILKNNAKNKSRKSPSLEDCRAKMQSNLPKAHDKALRSLTQTIGFFSNVFQAASSCSSVEEMVRRLGKDRTRFLAIYWSIIIDPRLRRKKELEPQPSYLHISLEILHPLSRIISVYKKIKAGLEKGNFNYECEYNGDLFYEYKCGSKDDQANGYVNSFFGMPIGDIHLCVDNMQDIDNITDVAETIIHEASHKFAGTNDDSNVPWENAHVVESGMPTHLK